MPDCSKCSAICCKHIALEIDAPTSKTDYDNIRWYLMHDNIDVFIDNEGDWYLKIDTPCRHLQGIMCGIYEDRPKICRDYPSEDQDCEFEGEGDYYQRIFHNDEEFTEYLENKNIDWRFKKFDKNSF